jgi:hypothetical protein
MKTKVSALEKRVLELEEENMALHLFATAALVGKFAVNAGLALTASR